MTKKSGTGREESGANSICRRRLLTRSLPACAAACMGAGLNSEALSATLFGAEGRGRGFDQETHRFDVKNPMEFSQRELTRRGNRNNIMLIRFLRRQLGDEELIRLLRAYSTELGTAQGAAQKENFPDNSFATFTAQFRPPNYGNNLTHEVVEDSETVFELKVTECIWAQVWKEGGVDGEIGHAAVCNMDYSWPTSFNPDIRMERTKTLMQGDECCNHRYILSTQER